MSQQANEQFDIQLGKKRALENFLVTFLVHVSFDEGNSQATFLLSVKINKTNRLHLYITNSLKTFHTHTTRQYMCKNYSG